MLRKKMKFGGVKSNLNKEKYNLLIQNEKKVIVSILEKGLNY